MPGTSLLHHATHGDYGLTGTMGLMGINERTLTMFLVLN